ncbi:extracellular solute-binding protein [Burkholderia cepacia]|uniref:extracellular solute-binding protein n=1 Tax=Burkholderia cepacia TaxID=292 RepID=UPI002AB65FF8|nr:extracellular solute-binding protein [Burkholderia cepacia]
MQRRRFLGSAAALAAGGTLELGLARVARAQPQDVVLKVSFFDPAFQPVMKSLIDKFHSTVGGIQIAIQTPTTSWDEQLQRTILDMRMGGAAELAVQGYNRLRVVANNKAAIPLDGLIATEKDWGNRGYSPALMSLGSFGGKQWGMPLQLSDPVIFYNADLFQRAGVDEAAFARSWESAVDAAAKITSLAGGVSGPFFDYTADGNWMYQALLFSLGGRMMSPNEAAITFDDATGLRALKILQGFGRSGQIDMTFNQAAQSFIAGKIGMIFSSNRRLGHLQNAIQDRFRLRTAPLPRLENGRIPVGGGFLSTTTTDPMKQRAAWEFIKFATGPVGQSLVVSATGSIPGNEKTAPMLRDFYAKTPQAKAGLDQLPFVTSWYSFPGTNAVKISDILFNHLHEVVTLKVTPAAALPAMRAAVQSLLPKA